MPNSREFLPSAVVREPRTAEKIAAAAPFGLDYPVTQVGVVGHITVSYDPSLGGQGLTLATQMLAVVSAPYQQMQSNFATTGGPVTVVVAPLSGNNDGSGGAYHYGCDFSSGGVLYLDATFANTTIKPLDLEVALYVAELSEAFMGTQNRGWGCGFSNGEGLSRYLAENASPGIIPGWGVTGPSWAAAGFPDWVTKTEPTDRDYTSTGCAIVYLYWMRSLGFTISEIVQAGGTTLAANYQALTGKSTAYQDLLAAVKGLKVTSDNPFQTGLYQMHGDGTIWIYTGPPLTGWQMLDNNSRARAIVASGNLLYQMHGDGTIWIYTGPPLTGWQMLDNNPRARAIAASGRKLYQLHDDGTIWIYTGPPLTGWQMLDNNPRTIAIAASGGALYQLHGDGTIWVYTGTPLTGWQMLDNNPATTAILASPAALYQMHGDGTIWIYTGPPLTGWQMLDNNPRARAIAADEGLYQLHGDGTVWIYTGPPLTGWQTLDNNPATTAIKVA